MADGSTGGGHPLSSTTIETQPAGPPLLSSPPALPPHPVAELLPLAELLVNIARALRSFLP